MKTNDASRISTPPADSPTVARQASSPRALGRFPGQSPYKRKRFFFVLAVTCQLLVLTGLASVKAYTLATGRTVTLRTVPVDPHDLFRGDYVELNYEISSVKSARDFKPGDQVWVILRKGD